MSITLANWAGDPVGTPVVCIWEFSLSIDCDNSWPLLQDGGAAVADEGAEEEYSALGLPASLRLEEVYDPEDKAITRTPDRVDGGWTALTLTCRSLLSFWSSHAVS